MARTFGAPTSVPAGNAAANRSNASRPAARRPRDPAHEVHDVAVTLDRSERTHFDRSRRRHPAEVVAREVDQHHVLGVLLRVGEQFCFERGVLRGIRAARPRAGDRTQLRVSAVELDQRLGRGADDHPLAELAVIHVGRRVEQPQRAIGLEGIEIAAPREAHRQHELVHVARGDRLLGAAHALRGTAPR